MKSLFAKIADKYDSMNRIMSLGLDCLWRRASIRNIDVPQGERILDLACGTGDFTLELAERFPEAEITGVDLTPEMIEIAKRKLSRFDGISFITGDAQNLSSLKSEKYSLIVCAFGFRNFPDKKKALSECHRLLIGGGKLIVLELFRPTSRILGTSVNAWLAAVTRLFASDALSEYRYLRKSVAQTVTACEFVKLAESIGFTISKKTHMLPSATCISLTK